MRAGSLLFLGLTFIVVACNKTALVATSQQEVNQATTPEEEPNDNLNAVLWVQTAAEYQALTRQAFTTAQLALDEALLDSSWTASLEQVSIRNYENLPPAVILDVDETVLDNSPFQARLIRNGEVYSSAAWAAWTAEEAAAAIPGAVAYTQEAASRGITVFYVTNRKSGEEEATRSNLQRLGFPLAQNIDVILTRGEQEAWASGDKTPRRTYLATRYRILQLVGDNLGDFIEAEGSPLQRQQAVSHYAAYWGMRWIVLPNPTYGNWEAALINRDFSKSLKEQRKMKRQALRH